MQICKAKNLLPQEITYIECNPDTNSKLSFYDEEFFQVIFDIENNQFTNPTYQQLTTKEIKEIIGNNLL
jgi:DNA-binding FadR family transcriptional regulator